MMRIIRVISIDPLVQSDFKVKWVIPVIAPDDVFFDGAHDAFGIRTALGNKYNAPLVLKTYRGPALRGKKEIDFFKISDIVRIPNLRKD